MTRLAGYEIVEHVSDGPSARVYRGLRAHDRQPVVIKALRDEYPDPGLRARLRHEHALLKHLAGAGAPAIHELVDSPAGLALIVADSGGQALDRRMATAPLSLREILRLAGAIATALDAIHQRGVIHKQIQPAHIVVGTPGADQIAVQLVGFGGATRLARETPALTHPELLPGDLAYISPEQTGRMNRQVDYRTDLYSLGVTLYQLLTGQLPFESADAADLMHSHIARRPLAPQALRAAGRLQGPSDAAAAPGAFEHMAAIVMRLLAKNAEDRYQSAYGLGHDLQQTLALYDAETSGQALPEPGFQLGARDVVARLAIPQKLYGRAGPIAALSAAFAAVVETGATRLLLVTGAPGVGKSSLVRELHKPMTPEHGRFVAGKFDQLQRSVPYFAWTQALNALCRELAAEPAPILAEWRARLLAAMGPNVPLIAAIVPEIVLVVGPVAEAAELASPEAQNRFGWAFQSFLEALGWTEQPLILFLDDLQWADPASLLLLSQTLRNPDVRHLLLIGAYRDAEVDGAHPLALTLAELTRQGVSGTTIHLADLTPNDVRQLVQDSLHCPPAAAAELGQLLHAKTAGNAFFVRQFLQSLVDDRLLRFSSAAERWSWNIAEIEGRASTANVVELLLAQLQRLPAATTRALQLAACIGAGFDAATLAIVDEQPAEMIATALWPALEASLVLPLGETYRPHSTEPASQRFRFAHDRIQQAAYVSIDPAAREAAHLRIGRLLRRSVADDELGLRIFAIVEQLNAGLRLVDDPVERLELAELNLVAGRKARASAAFAPAAQYFQTGLQLLPPDCWQTAHALAMALHTEAAAAAYLSGNLPAAFDLVATALAQTDAVAEQVPLLEIRLLASNAGRQVRAAVDTALEALRLLGVRFPDAPTPADIGESLQRTHAVLAAHPPRPIADWPLLTDPNRLATMRVITAVADAAYHAAPELMPLLVFEQIRLTAEHGLAPTAAVGFALYGTILCGVLDDIESGNRYGTLALEVLDRFGADEYRAITMLIVYNNIRPWQIHSELCLAPLQTAYKSGIETGDLTFAAVAAHAYCYHSYFIGKPLAELADEQAAYDQAIDRLGQQGFLNYHRMYRQAVLNLVTPTDDPARLRGPIYDHAAMLPLNAAAHDITALFVAHFCQCMLAYLLGDYAAAVAEADQAEQHTAGAVGLPHLPLLACYGSLARLATADTLPPAERAQVVAQATAARARLAHWAEHAPGNQSHRVALLDAELARVAGNPWAASQRFEEAIALARANRYPHEEGLALEVAARFYAGAGMERIARGYLLDAYEQYRRWGARAKLAELARRYPAWLPQPGAAGTTAEERLGPALLNRALDLDAITQALRIISGELVLERLLERVMRTVLATAGAERGLLLLPATQSPEPSDDRWQIRAEATVGSDVVTLHQAEPAPAATLPRTIVDYVARTGAPVVLDNAAAEGQFRRDPDIARRQVRAVVCLPLQNQGRLIGIVYLENNLTAGAFTPTRLDVLGLLAAQLAISLDNALLYRALEQHRDHLEELVAERTERLRAALGETARLYEEARAARALAEAASRAKSDFLANMSHELRTPLNAVLGFSQLMQSDPRLVPDQTENLSVINRSGAHLLKLINDVLEMSKIEAGRMTLAETDFDIQQLIDDLGLMFGLRAQEQGLQLDLTVAPDVPRFLRADEGKLRQILINVLGNAVKFTERGGVSLLVERGHPAMDDRAAGPLRLRFRIVDTGPGISAAEQQEIFEPFAQAEAGQRAQQGTGLGLALSRRLARLLGGDLVHAPGAAPGATFVLDLPAWVADAVAPQQMARVAVGLEPGQPAYRLLIADDAATDRLLLRRLLEPLGFAIAEATDGRAAVEEWRRWRPHLIWMDLRMPGLDGYAATREIRAAARGKGPRIIAVAASALADEQARVADAGCDDLVRKPFDQATIFEMLERHLGARLVYVRPGQAGHSPAELPDRELLAAAVARQPAAWVAELRSATVGCDLGQILALLTGVREREPELAAALGRWAEDFEYERIQATLDAATDAATPTA